MGRLSVAATVIFVAAVLAGCGTAPSPSAPHSGPAVISPAPSALSSAAVATGSPAASGAATSPLPATSAPTEPAPLAVVVAPGDLREGIAAAALGDLLRRGGVFRPCGLASLTLAGTSVAPVSTGCLPADRIPAAVRSSPGRLGLLPPGLVSPAVTVLRIGDADLFGSPSRRGLPYPLLATFEATTAAAAAAVYDSGNVRTIVSVGDTCPSRGVSAQAIGRARGWPWVLDGGTARYTGVHMDTRFSGPDGTGWPVVDAVRTGNAGAIRDLLRDADLTVDDFECPMIADFTQDKGTNFSVDPRVAPLMADAGFDVVTLGSNHITDRGVDGLRQTLDLLDRNGIRHAGAGMTLADALAPAIVDVRGIRFAFVGWDDIPGSGTAAAARPGVAAMTEANVRRSIAGARANADVVIAMPQWGFPEYHADFTPTQLRQRALMYAAGADHVLGSGTHWAGAISVGTGPRGPRLAVTSHGNFLFGQSWSRQTMEGVLVEATFVGARLAQVRLHPYVVLDQAQPNLLDPLTDGSTVLRQVYAASDIR